MLGAAFTSLLLSIFIFFYFPDFPFIHRMAVVFISSGLACYLTVLIQGAGINTKAVDLSTVNFSTSSSFNINTLVVIVFLAIIYISLW